MYNIKLLKEYLSSRPISVVFDILSDDEKNDETALIFMCIVDYEVAQNSLYTRINSTNLPKLLHDLLGFSTYKSFVYYDYMNNYMLKDKNLQCSHCQLFGPYALILTHMMINHNISNGYKLCIYCHNQELKSHFNNESVFQMCYENYLRKYEISEIVYESVTVQKIIKDFYCVLKKLSNSLGVRLGRQLHKYAGKGLGKPQDITIQYDNDISSTSTAHKQRIPKNTISTIPMKKLDELLTLAIIATCGETALSKLKGEESFVDSLYSEVPSDYDDTQPSTSDAHPRASRAFSTNTSTPSEFTDYGTNISGLDGDTFLPYLCKRIQYIRDPNTRRILENRLLKVVMEAEDNQPQ